MIIRQLFLRAFRSLSPLGLLLYAVTPGLVFPPISPAQSLSDTVSSMLRKNKAGYVRNQNNKRVVIFVNGIFGNAITSWTNSNTNKYWPAMLRDDPTFNDLDIYVFSFDSPKIEAAQTIDELARRMEVYLDSEKVIQSHKQAVFICHSMGGLVTRAYLLRSRPAPEKVPMIYFFATPTTGANVTSIANIVSRNPQLKDMLPLSNDGYVGNLQNDWLSTSTNPQLDYPDKIASYCAYEKLDTYGIRLVERQSATNLCNRPTDGIMANHIDIVKPEHDGTETYRSFKAAYLRSFSLLQAGATLAAINMQRTGQLQTQSDKFTVGRTNYTVLRVASNTPINVNCEQKTAGVISLNFPPLSPGEAVIQLTPMIDDSAYLKSSAAALIHFDQKSATIQYSLQGQPPSAHDSPCSWRTKVSAFVILSHTDS